jgi:hypothetical protein
VGEGVLGAPPSAHRLRLAREEESALRGFLPLDPRLGRGRPLKASASPPQLQPRHPRSQQTEIRFASRFASMPSGCRRVQVAVRPRERTASGICPARRAAPAESRLGSKQGFATATAGAFRGVPRPEGGDQAAGFRSCGIPLREQALFTAESRFASKQGFATATAGAFRGVPRPEGGDQAAGIRASGFLLREQAPSPSTTPAR